MWSAWLVAAAILLSSAGIMAFDGDSQLFGNKEDEKNVPLKKAEKKIPKKAANIQQKTLNTINFVNTSKPQASSNNCHILSATM